MLEKMSSLLLILFCVCFIGLIYYLKKKGILYQALFKVLYTLYAYTKVGYYYHHRKLKKTSLSSHSIVEPTKLSGNIGVYPIPYLDDNYCYLIVNEVTSEGVAVDPAHPEALLRKLKELRVSLKAILTTHKHWDHSGGNIELRIIYPNIPIYGGWRDRPSSATVLLNGGEVINVGGLEFDAVWTPGHTVGHIVYVLRSTTPPCLFTGDHLFIGGCGKVFEDTYDAMLKSLNLIKNMDHASLIFPGHEYSWSNIQFAMKIDPQNVDVQEKYEMIRRLRLKRYATIPSTLLEELSYNPFLRTESLSVRRSVGVTSSDLAQHEVLELIRKEKDQFKPS